MADHWHRIEKVVKWTGFSVNAFAKEVGLPRAENLYQIKKGNNGISPALAGKIVQRYSEISRGWLMTGEGDMFSEKGNREGIPFYDTDITKLVTQAQDSTPNDYITLPMAAAGEFAARWLSRSMEPVIPQNAVVVCSTALVGKITPGNNYLVVGDKISTIRSVRKELYTTQFRLVPRNAAEFDQVVIDADDIKQIYRIEAIIII